MADLLGNYKLHYAPTRGRVNTDSRDILEMAKAKNCEIIVAVLPLSILKRIAEDGEEQGIQLWWIEMANVHGEGASCSAMSLSHTGESCSSFIKESDTISRGKHIRFMGFKRLLGIKFDMQFSPIRVERRGSE